MHLPRNALEAYSFYLGCDEELFALDETVRDSLLDTLSDLNFITVVTSTIQQSRFPAQFQPGS